MAKKDRVQTRLDADDIRRVEDYQRDRDITESEAVRRLVQRGLLEEGYTDAAPGAAASVRDDLENINEGLASIRRSVAGVFVAVVYTAAALLAPRLVESTLIVNAGLTVIGLILIIGLSVTDVIDIRAPGHALGSSNEGTDSQTDAQPEME
jgi:hypothetical protein